MAGTPYGKHTRDALGTFATVMVTDSAALDIARALLDGELAAIDAACSRFRPDSELTQVCAASGRPVPVSPLLAEALSVALTAAKITGGDVDPTCGRALVSLGYDRDFTLVRPDTSAPRQPPIRSWGGWRGVKLSAAGRQVTVPEGVLLDLGATAKALAADRAVAAIAATAGCGALVNLGGDISVAGPPPEGGWLVGVADGATFDTTTASVESSQVIVVRDGGLATSSVLGRSWRRGRTQLHHIIDPRTGLPARPYWRTVSVAARSCVDANTATTAAIVRGERAVNWLDRLGLPARLVRQDGAVVTVAGWPSAEGTG